MSKPKRDYKALFAANPVLAAAAAAAARPLKKVTTKRKFKAWADPVRLLMGEGERAVEMVREFAEAANELREEWAEATKELREEQGRGPGRPKEKWLKAFVVAVVPRLLNEYPKLGASKNASTEKRAVSWDPSKYRQYCREHNIHCQTDVPENACAIVAEGLRRAGIKVTDKAVANHWDRRKSRVRVLRYARGKKAH